MGLLEHSTLQLVFSMAESREPVHNMYAMLSGDFPSPGRNTLLNGLVGAMSLSICMESITLGYLPYPYSGFPAGGNNLKPVETTTDLAVISSTLCFCEKSIASAGHIFTH
jgi:hypothetical protein